MTPADRRFRKQNILDAIDALIQDAPNSEDIEGETERIVIDADPGRLTVLNSKETLRSVREHIKKYETVGPEDTRPKIPRSHRRKLPKLGSVGAFGIVSKFTASSRHEYREELKQIRANGEALTATNGKTWIQVKGDFSGTTKKPIFLDPKTGKEIEQKSKFPKAKFSKSDESPVVKGACISDLLTQLYVVRGFLKGSESDYVLLFKNSDCSLGLYAPGDRRVEHVVETIETNLDLLSVSAEYVNSFNAELLQFVLESLIKLGFQNFDVSISDQELDSNPLVFRTSKATIVLMPVVEQTRRPMLKRHVK